MKGNLEKFQKILIEHGMRVTLQRLVLLAEFYEKKEHPSAEEIWQRLKKRFPSISRATVYNILNAFEEKGIVIPLNTPYCTRYDFNNTLHSHFICQNCGKIIDIDIKEEILCKFKLEGKKIEKIDIQFYGYCEDCLKVIDKNE